MKKFNWSGGSGAVAIIIGSFFVLFLVLMNPNAEAIMKSVDNAGIGTYRCRYAVYGRDSWRYFSILPMVGTADYCFKKVTIKKAPRLRCFFML